jgi:hypothetical protein
MNYPRPGKLRGFKRPFAKRLVAILILGLGAAGDVVTHHYTFIVGGAIGIFIGVLGTFIQRRRPSRTASSPDVG